MANAIEARKGLLLLQELLPKHPAPLSVILPLENFHHPSAECRLFFLQEAMLRRDLVSTGGGN